MIKKKEEEERLTLEFLKQDPSNKRPCNRCKIPTFFKEIESLPCSHRFCHKCLKQHYSKQISEGLIQIKCILCPSKLTQKNLKNFLSEDEYEDLESKQLEEYMKSNPELFVFCPKCNKGFERVQQDRDMIIQRLNTTMEDVKNSDIHKEQYRFKCRNCNCEFCSKCGKEEYHEGFTCDEYKKHIISERCRFCDNPVENINKKLKKSLRLICNDCKEKSSLICTKKKRCGHFCNGVKGDKWHNHLPCLKPECIAKMSRRKRLDVNGDDFCNICWVESLSASPCIKLKCGHVFHYQCCVNKIKSGWNGPVITFGFINCPLCKKPMKHNSLKKHLKKVINLKKTIDKRAVKRLKFEGLNKSDDLVKKGGEFYKNPKAFAEKKLAYYLCHKCGNPYFGGMKSCEDVGQDRDFKKEDLLCGCCSAGEIGYTNVCKLHGAEFVQFKCKFCCNPSCWFCWYVFELIFNEF